MNERIDELMIEAGARFEFLHGVHYDDFQYKKFAELIVRDCMDVVDGYTKSRTFDTHYDAVEQIEVLFGIKHFGEEE
jgi:hypothetical protein